MLIIPAIHIRNGLCVQDVHGEPGTENFYGMDPVQRTRLWRGENAKALHVIDLDGAYEGFRKNADVVRKMVECVDIPIQLGGGFRTYDTVAEVLQTLGVFRIIVGTMTVENPKMVERLVTDFTPRKIIIGIDVKNGFVYTRGRVKPEKLHAEDLAIEMRNIGVQRIVYTNIDHKEKNLGPPLDELKRLADATGLALTLNGAIRNYADLHALQALHDYHVDSVVPGEALYENAFPCQKIWRMNERSMAEIEQTQAAHS